MSPIFYAIIEKGKVMFRNKERFNLWVGQFEGKTVEVVVRPFRNKKSDKQHRYYWGVIIKIISDETGNDPLEVHEVCKMMFLQIDHESTMSLDTKQAEEYNEKIRGYFAREWNIIIPMPHEVEI